MKLETTQAGIGRKLDTAISVIKSQAPSLPGHARERIAVTLDLLALKIRPK